MEHPLLTSLKDKVQKSINNLESKFEGVRTGRASTKTFENIVIDSYGSTSQLNLVAAIRIPEPRLVVIQPWDTSLIAAIEKAIQKETVSLNPINDGKLIRIQIPPLTDVTRKESVMRARKLAEEAKIAVRNIRRDTIEKLKKLKHDSEISEDELANHEKYIQTEVDKAIDTITNTLSSKEKEIMEE